MSGLSNTRKRMNSMMKGKGYTTGAERQQMAEAKAQAKLDAIYSAVSIPDDEAIKRNERRKAAKRQGSRASTVLTDRVGLGG